MFLSCGDSLFDLFADAQSQGPSVVLNGRVGGSPLNVALGLARLGQTSAFLTKISADLFGRKILDFMRSESIDTRFVIPTDRNTTLAMVSLGPDRQPTYSFYIDGTADRSMEIAELPESLPSEVTAIHFASYSTVIEPTASALMHLAEREKSARFISYDPNIRSSIEPDLDKWRARAKALVPMAALVKASDEDLAQLYPGQPTETVLADWIGQGARLAVATCGDKGALAMTAGGARAFVPAKSLTVVDTVGAGDTFQAALLTKLAEDGQLSGQHVAGFDKDQLKALLEFAVGAAAITCSRQGADLPRRHELG